MDWQDAALELGLRVQGWVALADLYPDSIQEPRSPWFYVDTWREG